MDPRDRFKCPCCGENQIDPRVVQRHRAVEQDLQRSVEVNSGYRCEKHNIRVGGSETSSHLRGLAWDVPCSASRDRWHLLGAVIRAGVNRIGIGKTYLHLDIDRQKEPRVVWLENH